ncbi:MAG: magnesium transporter CorA family protein [Nitrososphaeraceae archaeon]|jgi:magnesium transporter|nr:magnesium transporter CorA family protein [Nitrososphaeraceae archaeon]HMK58286.1 magnesium transporter CorA family protein [Nitrososphaeraceae archaeon]
MTEIGERKLGLESITNKSLTWVDIQKPTREKMSILEQLYPFHELNIEDCLSKIQIPKVDRYEDHIFVILHFPTIDKEKSIPRTTQLAIFAGFDYLVTVQQGELKPLTEMFQICKVNEKQRDSFMGTSSGYLLHSIIDLLVDDLLHILMKLEGNLDDIEDVVFDEKVAVAKEISLLRREITTLRRVVIPLKRIILDLSKDIQKFSEEDLTLYFDDVKDHIDKVIEVLEESKETIEIFKDTDFMLSTEKSNKILAVLTILFTLSIPATVVAAIYGMNVNLPGGIETGPATFFGPFTSFTLLVIAAILPAVIMIWYFKRQGWFGW